MPEQPKQGWWHTVPGLLTAAAAFLAALTGLVAGLSQTGLFDRSREQVQPPQTTASISPAEHDTSAPRSRAILPSEEASGPEPAGTPAPPPRVKPEIRPGSVPSVEGTAPSRADTAPAPRPDTSAATIPPAATPVPADSVSPTPDTAAAADSAPSPTEAAAPVQPAPEAPTAVLPSGTVLELAAGTRVCSTTSAEGDRFNAALVVPITVESGVALPVGTFAVLQIRRVRAPIFLNVRLDSIVRGGTAVRAPKSETRARRELVAGAEEGGAAIGACIPAGGRITATLRAPLRLGAP